MIAAIYARKNAATLEQQALHAAGRGEGTPGEPSGPFDCDPGVTPAVFRAPNLSDVLGCKCLV